MALGFCPKGEGHTDGLYNQNMTVLCISSELLTLKLSLMVEHYKPKCSLKFWIAVFTVKATGNFQDIN